MLHIEVAEAERGRVPADQSNEPDEKTPPPHGGRQGVAVRRGSRSSAGGLSPLARACNAFSVSLLEVMTLTQGALRDPGLWNGTALRFVAAPARLYLCVPSLLLFTWINPRIRLTASPPCCPWSSGSCAAPVFLNDPRCAVETRRVEPPRRQGRQDGMKTRSN